MSTNIIHKLTGQNPVFLIKKIIDNPQSLEILNNLTIEVKQSIIHTTSKYGENFE